MWIIFLLIVIVAIVGLSVALARRQRTVGSAPDQWERDAGRRSWSAPGPYDGSDGPHHT